MNDQWDDFKAQEKKKSETSFSNFDTSSDKSDASTNGWEFSDWEEELGDSQISMSEDDKIEQKKIRNFFKEKWRFISPYGNPYSVPNSKAKQVKICIPDEERKLRPSFDKKLFENPVYQENVSWCWWTIRALGTAQDKHQVQEGKLPKDFIAAASQLAASHQAFALACVGDPTGGAKFEIGQLKTTSLKQCTMENILRSSFGIAELECENKKNRDNYWQQANCMPIRVDTETLDRMSLQLEPGNWVDLAAGIVCDTDSALQVEFIPIDIQTITAITENLSLARKAQDELVHYLKDTQQVSGNYGINGSASKTGNLGFSNINKFPGWNKATRSYSGNYGYNSSQGISRSIETRDCEAEQMQKQIHNRIRLLEQMLMLQNGWTVRITIFSSDNSPITESLHGTIGTALQKLGYACHWESCHDYGVVPRSSLVLPDYLILPLISFPQRSFIGFEAKSRPNLNLNPERPQLNSQEIAAGLSVEDISLPIGKLVWNGKESKQMVRIPKKEINRHMFVCGKTGSGKSNTVTSFLTQLQDSLNYLVIEPVKGEYHALPNIRRYNMIAGDLEYCMQMNPFWFPVGSSLQYHVDSLKLIISAAFDLYAAMPNILEQCLYRVYINCGWDFVSGKNMYEGKLPEEYLFPTFQSLCEEVEQYLSESAFGDETRGDYEGALLSRLRSFTSGIKGLLLNTNKHIPVQDWAEKNVVVELDALADDADKAIVMGALLIQYFQYVKYIKHAKDAEGVKNLEHLFVLEEAHHLFKEKASKTSSTKGTSGSSSTQLVEMLDNLLAEARCYGEGFVIVDQSPSNVSTAVLKNTGVKIVHRSDYGDDVTVLQKVLLLEEHDRTTARLKIGHALVRYGTMASPCEIKIALCEEKEKSKIHPTTSKLSAMENAYDRVFNNSQIMEEINYLISGFVIQLLAEADIAVIQKMYEYFRMATADLISSKCGIDSVELLTDDDYYVPILQLCINEYANKLFPGQFCLTKMITLFAVRLAKVLAYYRKIELVDENESDWFEKTMKKMSQNQNLQKDWSILQNYRSNQIYSRMYTFYLNAKERIVGGLGLFYQDNYNRLYDVVQDFPVIEGLLADENDELSSYQIVMKDGRATLSDESESYFYEMLAKLVIDSSTPRSQIWKDIIVSLKKKSSGEMN